MFLEQLNIALKEFRLFNSILRLYELMIMLETIEYFGDLNAQHAQHY